MSMLLRKLLGNMVLRDEADDGTAAASGGYGEFSDVFASLTDKAQPDPAVEDDPAPSDIDLAAADAADVKDTDEPAEPAEPDETDEPAEPAEPDETDEPAAEPEVDWKAKFEELERQRAAKPEAPAAEAAPEPEPKPEPAAPIYNDEEAAFLKQYDEDWPDITKGEALKRRAEYQQIVGHVFSEIQRVYGPMVEASYQAAQTLSEDKTLDIIRGAHQDYDQIYDDVIAWADTLPSYMKSGAKQVMESGSPQEVIEFIADFKKLTGREAAPAATPPSGTPQLSDKAKQAAKTLSVVKSKRTAIAAAPDASDFDSAWDEANAS